MKPGGRADRLEMQATVNVVVLGPKAGGSGRISMLQSGGRIPSFSEDLSLFSLRPSGDGARPPTLWRVICFT